MKVLKFGVAVAGFAAPAHLKLFDGFDSIEKFISAVKGEAGYVVDEAVDNSENSIMNNPKCGANSHPGKFDLEVPEGADLRQLEMYLANADKGHVLSNLNRIVMAERHVNGVCTNHYHENYRQSPLQSFRESVDTCGVYHQEDHHASNSLTTSSLEKRFYDAIVTSRGIIGLKVNLGWDVTMHDLRYFAVILSNANFTSAKDDRRLAYFQLGNVFQPRIILNWNAVVPLRTHPSFSVLQPWSPPLPCTMLPNGGAWTPPQHFVLANINILLDDWTMVVKALDSTTLNSKSTYHWGS